MSIPQLGKTHPAILATDDKATIRSKIDSQLSRLRDAFDEHIDEEKASGRADKPDFAPNCHLSIPCVYVDEASAVNIHDNAAYGVRYALSQLDIYGIFLIDLVEWRNTDFTDENDEPPFPHHEVGVVYRLKVGDVIGHEGYRLREAKRFIEAKAKFNAGELESQNTQESASGGLAALLRKLGQ